MALKNIFDMVKADRYTADGCTEIKKAREADVEDRVYKIGEISQKTGLMKTANGWVKPKKGNNGSAKKEESSTNTLVAKFDEYGLPSNETIAMKDKFLKEENVADPSKLTNAEFNALAEKLDKKLGINNKERAQELLVAESEQSKPTEKKSALKLPDEKSSFSTDVNRMKKLKKEDYKQYTIQLEKLHSKYPINKWKDLLNKTTQDEAPRILTGDTKIRIRK